MKERPILFSAPMVRAILENRKTQTRRIVNRLAGFGPISEFGPSTAPGYDWHFRDKGARWHNISHDQLLAACPFGQPGDRLWVREAYRPVMSGQFRDNPGRVVGPLVLSEGETCVSGMLRYGTVYKADGAVVWQKHQTRVSKVNGEASGPLQFDEPPSKWKPSIHMPRWASRITLEITEVRAERLQDISEADAIDEGVTRLPSGLYADPCGDMPFEFARTAFSMLWDAINAPRGHGWDVNDWVFPVTFKRLEPANGGVAA